MTGPEQFGEAGLARLLGDYHVRPGIADELFDGSGAMRPVWRAFMRELSKLGPGEVSARCATADRYLRDAGVFYRQYTADAPLERDWPFSHIPVLLEQTEWRTICAGLAQRADLLEQVVADLYGPATLVRDGHLPAELVARNPEWHRPLVGLTPASGHYLHFLAFEIGRNPDGSWLVLGDRTQAPSGAGFALENRRATARSFPDPFPRAHVQRLAGFFRAFREAMDGLAGQAGARTAILTPGPGNDTYFEHAYIARYLGLGLLEGADLVVQDGAVQVRTVAGPQPISVLWRRLDAGFADPLELDERSRIGTPGLVDALRQGSVHMVNALGSGLLETRALMAFLPKLARVLLGTSLALPNVATWWCGQPSERAYVKARASELFIGDAFSRNLPFDIGESASRADADRPKDTDLADWIDMRAGGLVGQQSVTLSTTPVWDGGRLHPRPMSVRVFAARTPDGWAFLPGGYARIGQDASANVLGLQRGGSVADVWVMSDTPVKDETMIAPGSSGRVAHSALPSRAADNLFWLGRYIERTEGALRLLRAYHVRLAETGAAGDPRLRHLAGLLAGLGLDVAAPLQDSLAPALTAARGCAAKVRDRFAVDGWAALADLINSLRDVSGTLTDGDEAARALSVLLRKVTGFNGLVHENMHRTAGWRFLTMGRALERADGAAAALELFAGPPGAPDLLDLALEYGDSRNTHMRRYRIEPTRATVADLLALDAYNPRSILFQVAELVRVARDLPGAEMQGRVSPVLAVLLALDTRLRVTTPDAISGKALAHVRRDLSEASNRLTYGYLV